MKQTEKGKKLLKKNNKNCALLSQEFPRLHFITKRTNNFSNI